MKPRSLARRLLSSLFLSLPLLAGTALAAETLETTAAGTMDSRAHRANASAFALATFSPIDIIIPAKVGATLGYVQNADTTYEIEYVRGTMAPFFLDNFGKFTDQRLSVFRRSYFGGNSFNVSYGLSYFRFTSSLGSDYLSRLSNGAQTPGIDLLDVESVGANFGIGNRWAFDHGITLSVDWISWLQPFHVTSQHAAFMDYASDADDRKSVDDALKTMGKFPRVVLFKVQLGMLF